MPDVPSLLPPNSTTTERAIEQVTARLAGMPANARHTWNPHTCPAAQLPWLAWALSVDEWDANWSEAEKRAVLAASVEVHRRKGTLGAVRRVIAPRGTLQRVIEWWHLNPPGVPGTFALEVGVSDRGITEQTYIEMERLIDSAKPVSRHLIGLAIVISTQGPAHLGAAQTDGEHLDVYPYQPADITVVAQAHTAGADVAVDELDVLSTAP